MKSIIKTIEGYLNLQKTKVQESFFTLNNQSNSNNKFNNFFTYIGPVLTKEIPRPAKIFRKLNTKI